MRHRASRRDFVSAGSLGFLGLTLREYLAAAPARLPETARANSVILFWLEGGPSHIDTWDPKANSNFKPISTNVAGIQVSELLPQIAKRMDKLALVRSMHTRGTDHPQATHYVITATRSTRRCNSRAWAPSSPRKWVRGTRCRRTCWCRSGTAAGSTRTISGRPFWAGTTTPCAFRTPAGRI